MTNLYGHDKEYNAINDTMPFGISAGAAVFRKQGSGFEFLILGKKEDGEITYHLPKGTLHIDETLEECAKREIVEEAGVTVELKAYIGAKTEEYIRETHVYIKTLHYYAAEYCGESEAMDDEHDFREWCGIEDALRKLSPNLKHENEFISHAAQYLKNSGQLHE
jgi:8-oxo-dGTP pyrophosphatase MutT (NUDIX family)